MQSLGMEVVRRHVKRFRFVGTGRPNQTISGMWDHLEFAKGLTRQGHSPTIYLSKNGFFADVRWYTVKVAK